ncbi:MAG TPA: prepilin-type N-terminal cleavage/methylation domain-containing protein [Phycisphaerae bacterium]|nr:prepilin-type N-terminal cleavage/methylation domain-containing protein [Phycisphaerae bacterium]HOJ72389.1 prepilin-type N-terminal cleavage/methylation domain-containing protein [Phycisphaerae bacterium]HOM49949.1 prepilin-type N-terminal cleavage/methylation domain-containing protein [Phycisphaerae bacterium]HON66119.1 prepilin-type N-terminal cleavage/methylation domain-containing protein [Phycisphaerae bacterium]HOQ84576.1 prepilin-type N-terminal cleavage/methylation domain-containing 
MNVDTTIGPDAKGRGFTLIEVLVVVAIIALLLTILMPSLFSARAQTREVVCLSNLHQLGLTMEMYVSTYNCYVPVVTEKGEYGRWLRLISNLRSQRNEPRRSSITILGTCPSVPERGKVLQIQNHRMDRDISYGYNYIYLGDSRWLYKPGTTGRFPVRPTKIKYPAATVELADSEGTGGWCPEPNPYTPDAADGNAIGHHGFMIDPPALPPDATNGPAYAPDKCPLSIKPGFSRVSNRHRLGTAPDRLTVNLPRGGSNTLFVDGHATWVDRKKLESLPGEEPNNSLWNGLQRKEP